MVVDASAIVELLLGTERAERRARRTSSRRRDAPNRLVRLATPTGALLWRLVAWGTLLLAI
jgi:hypothetical protein